MRATLTKTYRLCIDRTGQPYSDYFVSHDGEVISTKFERIKTLRAAPGKKGYLHVTLSRQREKKCSTLERAVKDNKCIECVRRYERNRSSRPDRHLARRKRSTSDCPAPVNGSHFPCVAGPYRTP